MFKSDLWGLRDVLGISRGCRKVSWAFQEVPVGIKDVSEGLRGGCQGVSRGFKGLSGSIRGSLGISGAFQRGGLRGDLGSLWDVSGVSRGFWRTQVHYRRTGSVIDISGGPRVF